MDLDTQESGWKKAGEGSVKKGTCRRGLEKGELRLLGTASGRAPRDGAGSRDTDVQPGKRVIQKAVLPPGVTAGRRRERARRG